MNDKPKIEGAKPLLTISANEDFAVLDVSDPAKLIEAIYEALCAKPTQPTMCIMMAVEKFRSLNPTKYRAFIQRIYRFLRETGKRHRDKQNPTE